MFDVRPDAPVGEQFMAVIGRVMTAEERARFAARSTALLGITEACSQRYNTVVLRDPAGGEGWLVYALAATTEPGLIMVGGHYRFTISADGEEILRGERLSDSCLSEPAQRGRSGDRDQRRRHLAGVRHGHLPTVGHRCSGA